MENNFDTEYKEFSAKLRYNLSVAFLNEIESYICYIKNNPYYIDNNEQYLDKFYRLIIFPVFYSDKNPVSYEIRIDNKISIIFELKLTYIEFIKNFYNDGYDYAINKAFILASDKLFELIQAVLDEVFNDK